jgi:hypothetical protein
LFGLCLYVNELQIQVFYQIIIHLDDTNQPSLIIITPIDF